MNSDSAAKLHKKKAIETGKECPKLLPKNTVSSVSGPNSSTTAALATEQSSSVAKNGTIRSKMNKQRKTRSMTKREKTSDEANEGKTLGQIFKEMKPMKVTFYRSKWCHYESGVSKDGKEPTGRNPLLDLYPPMIHPNDLSTN